MDLEVARKALSKRGAFSSKRVAFFGVAGLSLVVGILLRSGQYFGQPEVEQNAPVTVAAPPPSPLAATPAVETQSLPKIPPPAQESANAPNEQAEQTGEVVEQAEQAEEAARCSMAYHSAENRRTPPVFSADHKRGDSLFAMTTGE